MCWCRSRGADSSVTLFRIGHHLSPPGNILTSQGLNLVYNTKARVTEAFKLVAGVDSQPRGWIRMGREPLPVVVNGYWRRAFSATQKTDTGRCYVRSYSYLGQTSPLRIHYLQYVPELVMVGSRDAITSKYIHKEKRAEEAV